MTNLTQIARNATAAIGALVISAAFVTAAVGPAAGGGNSAPATYAAAQISASVQAQA